MPKRVMREFSISEISAVTSPAQEGARMAIMKRAFGPLDIAKEVQAIDFNEAMAENEARDLAGSITREIYDRWSALQHSFQTISCDETLAADAKISAMRDSLDQFVSALGEVSPDAEKALRKCLNENPALAGLTKAGISGSHTKEGNMPADETKKVGELESQIADLNAKLTTATAQIETLTQSKTEAETAKSTAEAKVEELTKAADIAKADETFEAEGTIIRKSEVGDGTFKVLKAQQERIELGEFTKSAETAFSALPGEPIAKAKALRAVSKLSKEDRDAVETMLKSGQAALQTQMKALGKDGGGNLDTAEQKLDALAKEHAEKHNVSKAIAFDAVLSTAKGAELYDQAKQEKPRVAA